MQPPTCSSLRVRSTQDALAVFHAVALGIVPMIPRRLDNEERRAISSGSVFVWEERGPHAEATGLGIERWTDGIRWGPSRVRDEFLFYHEKEQEPLEMDFSSDSDSISPLLRPGPNHGFRRDCLIKQTYSVFVETPRGRRKWHLIAYFTQNTLNYLRNIDDIPQLANLHVPPGKYKSARSAKGRIRERRGPLPFHETNSQPQYAPYTNPPPPPRRPSVQTSWPHPYPTMMIDTHRQQSLSPQTSSPLLAPLEYLQNLTPPHREPHDEQILMFLRSTKAPMLRC
ncbi:Gti1/Pac2 family-domain-containing protein [Pterulicium gracile]|uniref:Gti1/Pac2 family-domain-containing protein n=1 Tax=Pterulicium gracile TaxID=1884261 RepID=A0A5C3QXG7_9AGAR|nr:Gti1/Pac2 family-domain-containing protein [Pterula gracilis]